MNLIIDLSSGIEKWTYYRQSYVVYIHFVRGSNARQYFAVTGFGPVCSFSGFSLIKQFCSSIFQSENHCECSFTIKIFYIPSQLIAERGWSFLKEQDDIHLRWEARGTDFKMADNWNLANVESLDDTNYFLRSEKIEGILSARLWW